MLAVEGNLESQINTFLVSNCSKNIDRNNYYKKLF